MSVSRAQGTSWIVCPPRPPAGFFRYVLPTVATLQAPPILSKTQGEEIIQVETVLDAVSQLESVGYRSSLDMFTSLGFHSGFRELELGQWPLVICLTVLARTSATETVHVSKHLLIAQIPFHHKNSNSFQNSSGDCLRHLSSSKRTKSSCFLTCT